MAAFLRSALSLAICLLLSAEAAITNYNYNSNQQQQQQQLQTTHFGASNPAYAPTIGPIILAAGAGALSDKNRPQKPHRPLDGDPENRVLDRFSHRYPDGSYEFRYELADGSARYERGYFLLIDKVKILTVVGYYSYRSPDGRYVTVFYNADQNGYRQNQSITPQVYPNLPRSIDVPQYKNQPEGSLTPFTRVPPTTTHRGDHF